MKNFNRFTIKAQEALQNAQDLATQKNHGEFKAIHLLSALLSDGQSLVQPLLIKAGVNLDALDQEIEEELKKTPKVLSATSSVGQLYLSHELMQVLDRAGKVALSQKDEFIAGKSKIPLMKPSFGAEEVNEAIDSFLSTWVTMGKKVKT